MRWPSIQVGDQPGQLLPSVRIDAPSISRPRHRENQRHGHVGGVFGQNFRRVGYRDAARMRRGDVDIVDAVAEIGDHAQLAVGMLEHLLVDHVGDGRHQHIGGADRVASCSGVIGVSSRFNLASNSSRIRVSIESGSLRVTTTRGFFLTDMSCSHEATARQSSPFRPH
jgi:hypothetical protein